MDAYSATAYIRPKKSGDGLAVWEKTEDDGWGTASRAEGAKV